MRSPPCTRTLVSTGFMPSLGVEGAPKYLCRWLQHRVEYVWASVGGGYQRVFNYLARELLNERNVVRIEVA